MTQNGVVCRSFLPAFVSASVPKQFLSLFKEELSAIAKYSEEISFDTKLSNGDEK